VREVTYAMIPARSGSERLKLKNLAMLAGRPLVSYALEAAKQSGSFDEIYLNSDAAPLREIADQYDVGFYERHHSRATNETRTDEVVADFMSAFPRADVVAWINPVCPLQTGEEVRMALKHFQDNRLDSMISVEERQVHAEMNGLPINFDPQELFAKTQDLEPVSLFAYSTMIWRAETFLDHFETRGFGTFCGKFGTFPTSRAAATMVKTADDLAWADLLIRARAIQGQGVEYDPVAASVTLPLDEA